MKKQMDIRLSKLELDTKRDARPTAVFLHGALEWRGFEERHGDNVILITDRVNEQAPNIENYELICVDEGVPIYRARGER